MASTLHLSFRDQGPVCTTNQFHAMIPSDIQKCYVRSMFSTEAGSTRHSFKICVICAYGGIYCEEPSAVDHGIVENEKEARLKMQ